MKNFILLTMLLIGQTADARVVDNVYRMPGAGNIPGWGAIDLTKSAAVSGVLPNANTTAASANTASAIVARDGSGNFSAGTISAALSGNASTATSATSATTATNIAGGAGGSVPYQSAANTTVLLANGSSGQFLKSNGTTLAPSWASPTISLTAPLVTTYASGSGTHTFTGSPVYVRVRMIGGGGGGSGSGSTTPAAATAGGNSTFGTSLLAANGGSPGVYTATQTGAAASGGSASLGSGPVGSAFTGSSGGFGQAAIVFGMGGIGGQTIFGGGGVSGANTAGGSAISNTGGGGGGAGGSTTVGGQGGGGSGGVVDAVISGATLSGLSGSAPYSVGTAGAAGGAGTSGFVGGGGSIGYIEVTEYYQ